MATVTKSSAPGQRITVIDAFRGFALAGIVLIHFVERYVAGPLPESASELFSPGILDGVVNVVLFLFVRGKFFALFSLLFGLSFYIQMERGASRGVNFRGRFIWRLVLLFGIGYMHHLFYRGDILTIYAAIGLLLPLVYNWSNRSIFILAGLAFLLPRYLIFAGYGDASLVLPQGYLADEAAQHENYWRIITTGSLLDVWRINGGLGMLEKTHFQVGIFGRAYLTFAFFLVGMWLGRIRFFQRLEALRPQLRRVLRWSIVGWIVLLAATAGLFAQTQGATDGWLGMLAITAYDLQNLVMTALILVAFCLIYLRTGGRDFFERLSPYGRTALTNYVFQSVIGTFLLFGWGLGWIGVLSDAALFGMAVAVVVIQVAISGWWLRYFYYGPLEWLWRCATYGKWFPFRRRALLAMAGG